MWPAQDLAKEINAVKKKVLQPSHFEHVKMLLIVNWKEAFSEAVQYMTMATFG